MYEAIMSIATISTRGARINVNIVVTFIIGCCTTFITIPVVVSYILPGELPVQDGGHRESEPAAPPEDSGAD